MYGHKRYDRHIKPVEQPAVGDPTFVCSKCQIVKLQSTGYTDIFLTTQINPKKPYRICTDCSVLLQTWINK